MWKYNGETRPDFAKEPGDGEESVWDYPRPPSTVPDDRKVEVRWMGQLIAQTEKSIRVLETASPPTFYLPPTDVNTSYLKESSGSSFCEWKGSATYWNIEINGRVLENAAWLYEDPNPAFRSIAGYFSFYPAKVDCYVDDIRVKPQPGSFYGGWMTPEIVGPVKGEPGSGGW
ncbi:DUF427 domain-containing protein [Rhodohalobacter sp. 8-1]|uniref:DUF427 domain-containing protein n=1 Tax=Rhodohalobacter sp. 8-1 TaxID=3131972 RepID=UPI0030ED0341